MLTLEVFKLDFSNAFNPVRRDTILANVAVKITIIVIIIIIIESI